MCELWSSFIRDQAAIDVPPDAHAHVMLGPARPQIKLSDWNPLKNRRLDQGSDNAGQQQAPAKAHCV